MFLKLGSAEPRDSVKGCQGFQHTKIRNGGTVLFAVLGFYVRIKIHVATFDTNYSVTEARRQSIATSVQKFPDSVVKSVSRDRHR